MRIKLDEIPPEGLADMLRSAKYHVATLLEENLGGARIQSLRPPSSEKSAFS
jgi:hypothetical protein